MPAWLFWLIAAGALVIAETLSLDLLFVMAAGGALVGGGAAALGAPVIVQVVAFAVSALGLLVFVRPVAKRHMELTPQSKMGIEALVGREAVVVTTVDGRGGLVKLGGEEWSAQSYVASEVFEVGRTVRVMEIRGATAVVWGGP